MIQGSEGSLFQMWESLQYFFKRIHSKYWIVRVWELKRMECSFSSYAEFSYTCFSLTNDNNTFLTAVTFTEYILLIFGSFILSISPWTFFYSSIQIPRQTTAKSVLVQKCPGCLTRLQSRSQSRILRDSGYLLLVVTAYVTLGSVCLDLSFSRWKSNQSGLSNRTARDLFVLISHKLRTFREYGNYVLDLGLGFQEVDLEKRFWAQVVYLAGALRKYWQRFGEIRQKREGRQ